MTDQNLELFDISINLFNALCTFGALVVGWQAVGTWRKETKYSAFINAKNECLRMVLALERCLVSCFGSRYTYAHIVDHVIHKETISNQFAREKSALISQSLKSADEAFDCLCKVMEFKLFLVEYKGSAFFERCSELSKIIDDVRSKALSLFELEELYSENSELYIEAIRSAAVYLSDKEHETRNNIRDRSLSLLKYIGQTSETDSVYLIPDRQ